MNIQPYGIPDRRWEPKLTMWWFHAARFWRKRALKGQKIVHIDVHGLDHLAASLKDKKGILITPNHSFHWDSYCLLEGAERLATPFYFMSAWQVFAQSSWFECESMMRCGCFSVDREGTDVQSLKTAVDILQKRPQPLVVFPEGDVYHTNDRITPFRDGAAAMAIMAARKADRPIVIIPVAIKRWYTEDPTPSMLQTVERLERRLYWRPRHDVDLIQRIFHVADGLLSLKELECFGQVTQGALADRIRFLTNSILERCENRYSIAQRDGLIPERVKEVRRRIIQLQNPSSDVEITSESMAPNVSDDQRRQWAADMDDMFLATQLYSYPGDYLEQHPSWERLAETLDKLEEDALNASYPSVRGARRVLIRFDEPIELPPGKEKRVSPAEITDRIENRIQTMLDEINQNHGPQR